MSIHSMSRMLKTGFGLALVASFALMSGSALSHPSRDGAAVEEGTIGEAASAIDTGIFRCTLGSGSVMGSLLVRPDETCRRFTTTLAGASNRYCPQGACVSCYSLARDIGCILEN
ncbi:hypothetical protein [Polyangium sp. 15x6]|uniref:hypothetical protein n=1 Tax=Polyangium sp. 15x6 TaxID=3042687 RepID=UPI00249BA1A1|nr:hypothetical protein [Polyangium sp. 15x6]MDI3287464.1 hypothetical protein [Polyangium sp. 15x6]